MDIEAIRRVAEYAPHLLTPEDRRALRFADLDKSMVKNAPRVFTLTRIGIAACILGLAALPLFAEPINGNLSTVDMGTSATQGAVADVTFRNELEGTASIVPTVPMEYEGVHVDVDFLMMPGNEPDRMTVTVPEDYIAIPPFIYVNEGESGTITIYRIDAVGV